MYSTALARRTGRLHRKKRPPNSSDVQPIKTFYSKSNAVIAAPLQTFSRRFHVGSILYHREENEYREGTRTVIMFMEVPSGKHEFSMPLQRTHTSDTAGGIQERTMPNTKARANQFAIPLPREAPPSSRRDHPHSTNRRCSYTNRYANSIANMLLPKSAVLFKGSSIAVPPRREES